MYHIVSPYRLLLYCRLRSAIIVFTQIKLSINWTCTKSWQQMRLLMFAPRTHTVFLSMCVSTIIHVHMSHEAAWALHKYPRLRLAFDESNKWQTNTVVMMMWVCSAMACSLIYDWAHTAGRSIQPGHGHTHDACTTHYICHILCISTTYVVYH